MKTGQLIGGKYRLVTLVGEGGMGAVWHAMHMQLGHDVAVKFLTHPGANSEVLLNRFFDEARTAASVRHRNVIDILDFGISDDGRPYMVMEFMEGESLAARLERGPALTLPEVTLTVALSLGGLAAVHDRGIIHRDLKPDNIFLTYDADGSFPKILDFGVSKDIGRDTVGERAVQTRDGVLLGTPQYMSPEQARGLKDIDHRTDLYSMGVILYEVLAGVRPFESENVGDILMMVMTGQPVPLIDLRPDLSSAICDVVERAMQKDRELRFPDARAMRIALLNATNAMRQSMVSSMPEGSISLNTSSAEFVLVQLASEQIRLSNPSSGAERVPSGQFSNTSTPEATAPTMLGQKAAPSIDISLRFDVDKAAPPAPPVKPAAKTARVPMSSFPPPPRKSSGAWVLALLLLSLATAALATELTYDGGMRAALLAIQAAVTGAEPALVPGADGGLPLGPDAGLGLDGGLVDSIRVRLRQVPDDAKLTVDGQVYPPDALPALRSGDDRVITILVRKRPEPFEIRVEAPGMEPFIGRRWATDHVSYRLHLEPLADAGAAVVVPDASVGTAPPPEEPEPAPTRRRRRRR